MTHPVHQCLTNAATPFPGGLVQPPLAFATNDSPRIRRYAKRILMGSPPLGEHGRHVARVRGEAGAVVEVAIGGDAGANSSRVPNRVT
jgi:hypothetical protein